MRSINVSAEPVAFSQWRSGVQNDVNYDYDLIPGALKTLIKGSLIDSQQGLCAYTGIGINLDRSHIEHLLPQVHWQRGQQDVAYTNMVACYPAPGDAYVPFGAVKKAHWPSPDEQHLFVSPRSPGCEARFVFNLQGKISVATEDAAARETVKQLGLDHVRLENLRKEAIHATLQLRGKRPPLLDLTAARKRLTSLEDAERTESQLEPFCFVLKQALRKHIRRLEHIRESKRKNKKQEDRQG